MDYTHTCNKYFYLLIQSPVFYKYAIDSISLVAYSIVFVNMRKQLHINFFY